MSLNRDSDGAIAAEWDAARRDLCGRERASLDLFLHGLPAGARLLDAGRGTCRFALAAQLEP